MIFGQCSVLKSDDQCFHWTCSFLGCIVDTPALEECPKWEALGEIIAEIREHNDTSPDPGRVLIAAEDDRTCSQIREVIHSNLLSKQM